MATNRAFQSKEGGIGNKKPDSYIEVVEPPPGYKPPPPPRNRNAPPPRNRNINIDRPPAIIPDPGDDLWSAVPVEQGGQYDYIDLHGVPGVPVDKGGQYDYVDLNGVPSPPITKEGYTGLLRGHSGEDPPKPDIKREREAPETREVIEPEGQQATNDRLSHLAPMCKSPRWAKVTIAIIAVLVICAVVIVVVVLFVRKNEADDDVVPGMYGDGPHEAVYLFNCSAPLPSNGDGRIYDMCWYDDETIFAAQYYGSQVFKFTIDVSAQRCTHSVIDSRQEARIACATWGRIYVTGSHPNIMGTFTPNGHREEWRPSHTDSVFTVAVSNDKILVGEGYHRPLSLYNNQQVFLYNISMTGEQFQIYYTHQTESGLIIATTSHQGNLMIIKDLVTLETIMVGGRGTADGALNDPRGVGTSPDGDILVCDFNNDRISIFTPEGKFIKHLVFKGEKSSFPWGVYVRAIPGKQTLMAAIGDPYDVIRFYDYKYK